MPWNMVLLAGLVLALSNFMVVLDLTIANVSVAHIAGGLGISPSEGTWVITSYAVAEAISVPLTGWLARRSVQLGQRVQAGAPLMSIVPLRDVWVDANFKEGQLRNLRIGQPVELQADVYGKKVEYHGSVEGLGAGTGAAFALLPEQNATGNWIKVVQRVPVRIALDPKEVQEHPLRVGLSMDAKVDVSNTDGRVLASVSQTPSRAQTSVFDAGDAQADAEVKKIIAANLGRQVGDAGRRRAVAAATPQAPGSTTGSASPAAVAAR